MTPLTCGCELWFRQFTGNCYFESMNHDPFAAMANVAYADETGLNGLGLTHSCPPLQQEYADPNRSTH